MGVIVTILFVLCLLLLLSALAGLVQPRWLRLKTRKEAAQAAGVLLILLFILAPFVPDPDPKTPPQAKQSEAQASHQDMTPPAGPVCEDLADRMERLECEHQRAMNAWVDSSGRISSEYVRYLTTACPPCEAQLEECLEAWHSRNPGKIDTPEADFNRCRDRAWPPSEWPRYTALPEPKIPPELSAHWGDIQRRAFSGR